MSGGQRKYIDFAKDFLRKNSVSRKKQNGQQSNELKRNWDTYKTNTPPVAIESKFVPPTDDDDVVYIGTTTTARSPQKPYITPDDVVYIGTTTPQSSPNQPDDVIYVGTTTSQVSNKRKARDNISSWDTRTKKSRFEDNSPQRNATNITAASHPSESKQREDDELDQSSNYKKRKKPDNDFEGKIKTLLPSPPLAPPPSFDLFMPQLSIPPPIASRNVPTEDSKPKRFKSSSSSFQASLVYNENVAAKWQPPSRFDENISQYECKNNAENPDRQTDFKTQTEKLENLGKISVSGSYKPNRFSIDTESYQHLPSSRKELSERISFEKSGKTPTQFDDNHGDNYKGPRKSRFSGSVDRPSQSSESNLQNAPQLVVGSDGGNKLPARIMNNSDITKTHCENSHGDNYKVSRKSRFSASIDRPSQSSENNLQDPSQLVAGSDGGNNVYRSDSSNNVTTNNSPNGNTGEFNRYGGSQYNSTSSGSYNLTQNKGGVANLQNSPQLSVGSGGGNNLPERIPFNKSGITTQFVNNHGDNYKVPRKSRFSAIIDRPSQSSENNLLSSPQFAIGSDVGKNIYPSDSFNNVAGNNTVNGNTGEFNQYGGSQFNNANSGSYNLSENQEVGVSKSDTGSFAPYIYNKDYNNGISSNSSSTVGNDKVSHMPNVCRNNIFNRNAENFGNSYNHNNDIAKQFGNNRNTGNAEFGTNTVNYGRKYNSSNEHKSENSTTNLNRCNDNEPFTSNTQNEFKPGYVGLKSDSTNVFSQVSNPVLSKNPSICAENKGGFGNSGSGQFHNKETFVVSGLQGNSINCKPLNYSSDISFPKNISQCLGNTNLKTPNPTIHANPYKYNTCNDHQPKYDNSKTFSQLDGTTLFGKSSTENTRVEYQSIPTTLGNNQNHQHCPIQNVSHLTKVNSFQNNSQEIETNSRFQESTGNYNNVKSNNNGSIEKNTNPLRDGEMKSTEYKEDLHRNANLQFDNFSYGGNSSQLGYNNDFENNNAPQFRNFENSAHTNIENVNINRDTGNIQFGMKRRTTGLKSNYQHNNAIDKLFGNKVVVPHHENRGCNSNFVSQLGQTPHFYNINPAPPVPDLTKPPPPLPPLAITAANTSTNNQYMNSKNFQNHRPNTNQRFGNKNYNRENNVGSRQTKGYGRNINGQNRNNNGGTRITRPFGSNANFPRSTKQLAGNNGPGARKGPGKFANQNLNRSKPNTYRNAIHNSSTNNNMKPPTFGTWKNKSYGKEPNKFAKLLEMVKTKYVKNPAKKENQKKLKKLKKSKKNSCKKPKSEDEHIDVNKQVFGDFVPIKTGLKKPAKGHLKPKPEIYWKEWWSLYGYVENSLPPIDPNDADVKAALNFKLLPNNVEFRKRKRILLVTGVAKILRHIKLNESDYALRDIFSVLKYKHQLEDPQFQQNLNAKETDRVEKVLKHVRKKTRRALFYQNMICRWHFSELLLKRASTGEAIVKCGHARKLMNDKAFIYLVWESIQELKKLISEDWPEFEQFYKSL